MGSRAQMFTMWRVLGADVFRYGAVYTWSRGEDTAPTVVGANP